MTSTLAEFLALETFHLSRIDICDADLGMLHALSIGVRWPHRAEDWQFMRQVGRGIAAIDEIGRVVGSAMWFPEDDNFATIGMVITSPRLQMNGAAQWLMGHAMRDLAGYDLGLNATRAAERLYRSLGFRDERLVYQFQGEVTALPPSPELRAGETCRLATADDYLEIIALDREAFRAGRTALLAKLFACSDGIVLERAGKIIAFSLARPFGRGTVVGPVVAADDREAMLVTHPHVAKYRSQFLRMDTREANTSFTDFIRQSGLTLFDTVTTMTLGRPWTIPRDGRRTYCLAAQTLG